MVVSMLLFQESHGAGEIVKGKTVEEKTDDPDLEIIKFSERFLSFSLKFVIY